MSVNVVSCFFHCTSRNVFAVLFIDRSKSIYSLFYKTFEIVVLAMSNDCPFELIDFPSFSALNWIGFLA